MSRNSFFATVLFVSFACCWAAPSFGDVFFKENIAETIYGKGVHAFFDQNYKAAIDIFIQVEQLDSADPRPYYFLALAYHRLHQDGNADKYFKKAGKFEYGGQLARDYNVSDALRRIQGRERLYVEKYRTQAKAEWQNTENQRKTILYSNDKAKENQILRNMSQHPVVAVPFGAQSIDPLGTGNKIEAPVAPIPVSPQSKEKSKEAAADNSDANSEEADDAKKTDEKEYDKEMKADDAEKPDEKENDDDPFADSDGKDKKVDDTKKTDEKENDEEMKADDANKSDEKKQEESDDEDPFK